MNKYLKLAVAFLACVAFVTQIISIYLSNTISVESIEATGLRSSVDEVSENNIMLQSEVLALSSYSTISSRAGELGYERTEGFVSLYDPVEVARIR